MKRLLVAFLSLSVILFSCAVPSPTVTVTPEPDLLDTPWDDRSLFKSGLVPSAQPVLDELLNASVYHLEFNIAEDIYHITGTEDVRYTNAEETALDEVRLRLFPNILGGEIAISNLKVDEQAVTPKYELDQSLLIVPLPKPIEPNQSIILHMDFAVTVPQTVQLNYGVLAYFEEVLALGHAYPMIAVYDDEGWNAEIPPQSGDVTYADASFFLVKVNAPKDLTLVTTGGRIDTTERGETQTLN